MRKDKERTAWVKGQHFYSSYQTNDGRYMILESYYYKDELSISNNISKSPMPNIVFTVNALMVSLAVDSRLRGNDNIV